jgi:hypothetical protein
LAPPGDARLSLDVLRGPMLNILLGTNLLVVYPALNLWRRRLAHGVKSPPN